MTVIKIDTITDKNRKADMFLVDYECNFCKHKFQTKVGKLSKGSECGSCSDSVVCPNCEKTIRTWD